MVDVGTETVWLEICGRVSLTDSAMDTDGKGCRDVVGRKATAVPPSRTVLRQLTPPTTGVKPRANPPAVLVKVATGSSYADTGRAVRQNSELHPVDLGAQVTSMRKTKNRHSLVELDKGAGSLLAVQKLSSAIATSLGDKVEEVSRLN